MRFTELSYFDVDKCSNINRFTHAHEDQIYMLAIFIPKHGPNTSTCLSTVSLPFEETQIAVAEENKQKRKTKNTLIYLLEKSVYRKKDLHKK